MSIIQGLIPWEYKLSAGFTVRGYYTAPTGKPVIHFIHGNGFCGLTFERLLVEFQDDYDLFISDAQGHGESDAGGTYPGWNKSAFNFEQVWQHYSSLWSGVPKIALAHSYGAVMTTLMMAKSPDLFDYGMLMDPVYSPPRMAKTMSLMSNIGLMKQMPLAKQAKVRTVEWSSYDAAWAYFHHRGTFKGWQDNCLESYLNHALESRENGTLHLKCPARIEAAIFATYVNKLWPAIKAIKKPMTILYGEKTYPFILKSLHKVKKLNAYYDFIEMPGGHCFMQEEPFQTAQEIKQKLRFLLNGSV